MGLFLDYNYSRGREPLMTRKARWQDHGAQLADGEREREKRERGEGRRKGGRERASPVASSFPLYLLMVPQSPQHHYYPSVQTQEPMGDTIFTHHRTERILGQI